MKQLLFLMAFVLSGKISIGQFPSNGQTIALNKLYNDLVIFIKSGALGSSAIFYPDNLQIEVLKKAPPIEIVTYPFKMDVGLEITRQTGKKFQEFIQENF